MRVLLVKPAPSRPSLAIDDFVQLEPLELEYLAAGLADHDVRLHDMRYDGDLESAITAFQPGLVATTAFTIHFYKALHIMQTAKRLMPEVVTAVGGHHATLMPHDFNRPEVDAIILGEGVFKLAELVERLERRRPIDDVPGLALPGANGLKFTQPRSDLDRLDQYPMPDRRLTGRHRREYFYLWWRSAALMRASVGCAYRCSFCPIWKAAEGLYVYRSPESVAEELKSVKEDFIYFCDDNAFFDSEKMERLYSIIRDEGIDKEYFFFARPDTLIKERDLVEKWAEIGLRQVFVGIEAVEADRLKPLNKGASGQTNREAIRILKANRIDPFAGFMVFPEFTRGDFRRILDYMDEFGIYYNEVSVLTPAPGTDLYEREKETLIAENYELFDYLHAVVPTALPRRQFYKQLANLFIRSYSPFRAVKLKPAHRPSVSLGLLSELVQKGIRSYLSLRGAWKAPRQAEFAVEDRVPDAPVAHP